MSMRQYFTIGGEATSRVKSILPIKSDFFCAALIIILAAFSRFLLIYFAQAEAVDSSTYLRLAENIFRGCGMSHSDPKSVECVLTARIYFPGYPAFIAFVWLVWGKSVFAVLIAQLICYLLALSWLLFAINKLTKNIKFLFIIGFFLALSPLQIGWYRFILTEPLVIATGTWFLAEIIISIAYKKLRVFHLALALSCSIYIRPDSVFMILAVLVTSIFINDFKKSIQEILLIIFLTSIPTSIWLLRNYSLGQPPISSISADYPNARGYFLWLDTWVVNEYERADANFPVWRREYSKIDIHASKFIDIHEYEKARMLVAQLKLIDGKEFPEIIDSKFEEIAFEKIKSRDGFEPFLIFQERVLWLLFNPFSSWGLPLEIKSINRHEVIKTLKNFDIEHLNNLTSGYKSLIFWKFFTFIYRVFIFLIFFALVCFFVFKNLTKASLQLRIIVFSSAIVISVKMFFHIYMEGLESRYLIPVVPWVESSVALWIAYCSKLFFRIRP
jgi:hypothetical protein